MLRAISGSIGTFPFFKLPTAGSTSRLAWDKITQQNTWRSSLAELDPTAEMGNAGCPGEYKCFNPGNIPMNAWGYYAVKKSRNAQYNAALF